MATYAIKTLEDRAKLQKAWERGMTPKEIAADAEKSVDVIYRELQRGRDGTRLEDGRLKYDATTAQAAVNRSLERRGRKTTKTERAGE